MKAIIAALIALNAHAFSTDSYMKGVDLYIFKDEKGATWFSLLPGTNRQKHVSEIVNAKVDEKEIAKQLSQLPAQTWVNWNNPIGVENPNRLKFTTLSKEEEKRMRDRIKNLRLDVH